MTTKDEFTPEEWTLILQGPASAGMMVLGAERGGSFRETMSIAKAYAEAHEKPGQSALLDEIVAAKPQVDHARFHSYEEFRDYALQHLSEAAALLKAKATEEELADYRAFILSLSERVASAHTEGAEPISEGERTAIGMIEQALV